MAAYAVTFARSARKELERFKDPLAFRIFTHIEALTKRPRPEGCKKLSGSEDLWRIRVGEYRVIYSIDDARRIVDITAIRHRSDAYR
jgi:mRNA interferase RelE/StbE